VGSLVSKFRTSVFPPSSSPPSYILLKAVLTSPNVNMRRSAGMHFRGVTGFSTRSIFKLSATQTSLTQTKDPSFDLQSQTTFWPIVDRHAPTGTHYYKSELSSHLPRTVLRTTPLPSPSPYLTPPHERIPYPLRPSDAVFKGGIFSGNYGPHGPEVVLVETGRGVEEREEISTVVEPFPPTRRTRGPNTQETKALTCCKITGDPNVPAGRLTFKSTTCITWLGSSKFQHSLASCNCQYGCDCGVLTSVGTNVYGYVSGLAKTAAASPRPYTDPTWSEAKVFIYMVQGEWGLLLRFQGTLLCSFRLEPFDWRDPPSFVE